MNAYALTAKFKLLLNYEKEMNYKYEPRFTKEKNNWKRHINFRDFKEDFIEDLSMFGFSPFILKTSKEQWKDPNIMRYKPRNFNYGLVNYVKRKQENVDKATHKTSQGPKKLKVSTPKETLFLSQALKQITRKSVQYQMDDDNMQTYDNSNLMPKENNKTTATNLTDNGGFIYVQKQSLFSKAIGSDLKRSLEFGLKKNLKFFSNSDSKRNQMKKQMLFQRDNSDLGNRFTKHSIIFKNQKIRSSMSQTKLGNSLSCFSSPKNSNRNKRDMKTRNRDVFSSDNLFSRAKILCQVNLSN